MNHLAKYLGQKSFCSKDITRAHSFPRQILPNSEAPFAKFRGSPRPPILEYTVPTLAQLCPKTLALLLHQTIKQKFYT